MYNKLPVKERIELMKSYRKANKDMSYRDMVKDYNDSYEKFRNGGKKAFQQFRNTDMSDSFSSNINNQNTDLREYDFNNLPPRQGPLAFVYPDTYKDNQIAKQNIQESVQEKTQEPTQEFEKEPVKKNKKPVKTQDTVKERYQAFFPNPAKTSNEALTSTPTYYGGKEQNMSQYPMTTAQKLIYKAKKAAEIHDNYNAAKQVINLSGFIPGPIGLGANVLAGTMDIAEGDYGQGIVQGAATALRSSQGKKAQVIKGLSNLITGKEIYDYSTTPEKTYPSYLPYYTDEYKKELFKPQSLTNHKYGGVQQFRDGGKKSVNNNLLSTTVRNDNMLYNNGQSFLNRGMQIEHYPNGVNDTLYSYTKQLPSGEFENFNSSTGHLNSPAFNQLNKNGQFSTLSPIESTNYQNNIFNYFQKHKYGGIQKIDK